MAPSRARPFAALLALVASCQAPSVARPWSHVRAGAMNVGVSTGWADYEAEVAARGTSGALAGASGTDTSELGPRYGAALKFNYFVTDEFSIGGIAELRGFDPDPVSPLGAELVGEDFETLHLVGSLRWFGEPFEERRRLRPFYGLDVGWVPGVRLDDVRVDYDPLLMLPSERVSVEGDSFWTIAPVLGLSYLLARNLSLELGAFYEFPLSTSDESVTFTNLGGATADVEVEPQGLVGFVGLTWWF